MRTHLPQRISQFRGLWARGNFESCPIDHGTTVRNAKFSQDSILSRDVWTQFASDINEDVRRAFVYNASTGVVYLIYMTFEGLIYTKQISPTLAAPVLQETLNDEYDMDFVAFNGRAYIVTSTSKGYIGSAMFTFDGTTWRDAGFTTPSSAVAVANNGVGVVEAGSHYFGIAVETVTGFISRVEAASGGMPLVATGTGQVQFSNIPDYSADANVAFVRLIATKVIPGTVFPSNGLELYPSYFIPGGRIATGVLTQNVNFYDSELLDDASYLQDIEEFPPGGSFITSYHNRLVVGAASDDSTEALGEIRHRLMFSHVGDPETFDYVDGIILVDPSSDVSVVATDGDSLLTGLTEGQEYRDILYVWKLNSCYGIVDNGDVPSTWPVTSLDQGQGSFLNGIITILDSGGINIEYLLVANKSGLFIFNGLFQFPEVSWKIRDEWNRIIKIPASFDSTASDQAQSKMHFVNDPIKRVLYCLCEADATPDDQPNTIFYCDYSETNVNDPDYFMNVKWSRWTCSFGVIPTSLVGYDTGSGTSILVFDSQTEDLYELGGASATRETVTEDFCIFISMMFRDPEEAMLHLSGVTVSVRGNGSAATTLRMAINDKDLSRVLAMGTMTIPINTGPNKTQPTNYLSQMFQFEIRGAYMNLQGLTLWTKPVYKTIPQ